MKEDSADDVLRACNVNLATEKAGHSDGLKFLLIKAGPTRVRQDAYKVLAVLTYRWEPGLLLK